ncbi:jg6547 [Pararge aegeria aegeria]|uniref:Jg6547 protein n=1 Tax=Pararge aegeria aegeria TaxID=348720 RepID=A0A8S4S6V4_9NEOP|nr:jg6547 [Pararge aegeria aegeria]
MSRARQELELPIKATEKRQGTKVLEWRSRTGIRGVGRPQRHQLSAGNREIKCNPINIFTKSNLLLPSNINHVR